MWFISVSTSPDPEENYVVGPFLNQDQAAEYLEVALYERDREYATLTFANPPDPFGEEGACYECDGLGDHVGACSYLEPISF